MNVLRTFVVVLLLAAGLAACGGNSDAEPSGPTLSDHSTATASATEASNGATATNDTGTRTSTATHTATTEDEKTEEPTAEATATTPGGSDDGDGNGSDGGAVDSGGYPANIIPLGCGDNILAPVDKGHQLPANCEPAGLEPLPAEYSDGYQELITEAADALGEMFAAAQQAGYNLMVCSSYRSYDTQVQTYNYWVDTLGKEQADRTSARPGHSEHQLGTTADVQDASFGCYLDESWGNTGAGQWLREHAHEFGFVISYPEGKEDITGYAYEPWHIRWVGRAAAENAAQTGQTLHEILLNE